MLREEKYFDAMFEKKGLTSINNEELCAELGDILEIGAAKRRKRYMQILI